MVQELFLKRSGALMMVLGALMALFYPSLWLYGKIQQYRLHQEWQHRVTGNSRAKAAPRAIGRLLIPDIWVDQIVLQGVGDPELAAGPGHFPKTAMPGKGNCVVAGHLNINGSPFKDLDKLHPGSMIAFQSDDGLFEFKVTGSRIISPDDVDVLKPSKANRLTLITCMPGAKQRYVVFCKQTQLD